MGKIERQELGKKINTELDGLHDSLNSVNQDLAQIAVNVKSFGAKGDGVTDDTKAIQSAIDSLKEGQNLFFPRGVYLVSKNLSLENYPNNDQPCVVLYEKNNISISGYGAKLKVKEHAQGIMEIRKSSDLTVSGLVFEGCGKFPPIDGNTGRGEKGRNVDGQDAGYNTESYWGTKRNNSLDTSRTIGNSYNGTYPTSGTNRWGTFEGGFIGNAGNGILIYDGSKRISLINVETFGFNYCGISVGEFDETKAYSEDVVIENCYSHDNYSGNYNFHSSLRGKLIASVSENSGHPDADPINHLEVNPGYGAVLRQAANYPIDTTIRDNTFINDIRKPIDSHAGVGIFVLNNIIRGGGWGGAIVLFASYSRAEVDRVIVTGNQIKDINVHDGFGAGIIVEGLPNENVASAIINDNIITNCRFNTYHILGINLKNVKITGNIIKDEILEPRTRVYSITVDNVEHFDVSSNFVDISQLLGLVEITPACVNIVNSTHGSISSNTLMSSQRNIVVQGTKPFVNIINNYLFMINPNVSASEQHISDSGNAGVVTGNIYNGNIAVPNETKNKLHIKLKVTFNATLSPVVNVLEGAEFIQKNTDGSYLSISSSEMIINYKNYNENRIPYPIVVFEDPLGLLYTDANGSSGRCHLYYTRQISSGRTDIGFRPASGGRIDPKYLQSGTIFVNIEY